MRISTTRVCRRCFSILTLISLLFFVTGGPALAQAEQSAAPGSPPTLSEISGSVRLADGSTTSAELLLVAMDSTENAPTYRIQVSSNGKYEKAGMRHGYYRVGLLVGDQAYVSNRLVLLEPKRETEANFTLGEFIPEDRTIGLQPGSQVPGAPDRTATGVARLEEDFSPKGWEWFQTNRGVAVLLGGSTLLIGGLILLSDDDDVQVIVSPTEP